MIRLVNYKLAKLYLRFSKEGESIKFSGKESHNLTVKGKSGCTYIDKYQFW